MTCRRAVATSGPQQLRGLASRPNKQPTAPGFDRLPGTVGPYANGCGGRGGRRQEARNPLKRGRGLVCDGFSQPQTEGKRRQVRPLRGSRSRDKARKGHTTELSTCLPSLKPRLSAQLEPVGELRRENAAVTRPLSRLLRETHLSPPPSPAQRRRSTVWLAWLAQLGASDPPPRCFSPIWIRSHGSNTATARLLACAQTPPAIWCVLGASPSHKSSVSAPAEQPSLRCSPSP